MQTTNFRPATDTTRTADFVPAQIKSIEPEKDVSMANDVFNADVLNADVLNANVLNADVLNADVLMADDLIALDESQIARTIGGKANGLLRLLKLGAGEFNVPPFFVVRAGADFDSQTNLAKIKAEVDAAVKQLGTTCMPHGCARSAKYAVRSSCSIEDQQDSSFAGQFESHLCVDALDVFSRVQAVVASLTATNVQGYQKLMHIKGSPAQMAVIVQTMIQAETAGVMFSQDPLAPPAAGGATRVVINATDGLADRLVQGLEDGEHITVCGDKIERNGNVSISSSMLVELAILGTRLEKLYGFPVDVEWAIEGETIYILQVRPITALSAPARVSDSGEQLQATSGLLRVFDGSNIQESYPGVTTPMTFSFVRRAYKDVYRSFVRLMGVPDKVISQNEDIFAGMLGYIDGHVYYNLGNWYRLLALLPAYQTNRCFMEKMMGLKEPALAVSPPADRAAPGFKANVATALALVHIGMEYIRLDASRRRFYERLEQAVDIDRSSLEILDMDSLCKLYRRLEMELLTRWDAPIVNDFFAMIFFGIYQKLNSDTGSYHSLIEGLGNVVSAEPPKLIREIANQIKDDSALTSAILRNPQAPCVDRLFRSNKKAYALYQDYLRKFGDRSIGELKLESRSVRENPALLLSTIATLAQSLARSQATRGDQLDNPGLTLACKSSIHPGKCEGRSSSSATDWDLKKLLAANAQSIVNGLVLAFISKRTRELIAGRENLRFARTRVFGLVRDIMLCLADRLVAQKLIDDRQDVFYLEIEEVLGFVEGGSTCKNLRGLVTLRRAEERKYQTVIPDRISSQGPVGFLKLDGKNDSGLLHGAKEEEKAKAKGKGEGEGKGKGKAKAKAKAKAEGEGEKEARHSSQPSQLGSEPASTQIKGLPACSGKVRGTARVIKDPACEHLLSGEILIAERTDPGWIIHFALCRGIVTSYGSMLSHTAIVARELKIPAVVAAKGATERICSGDMIEVDGAAGTVTIIEKASDNQSATVIDKATHNQPATSIEKFTDNQPTDYSSKACA